MPVTIDLTPEVEASLSARADDQGLSLGEYLRRLIGDITAVNSRDVPSAAGRVAAWRAGIEGLPRTPPLSDEAISRASIYDSRG